MSLLRFLLFSMLPFLFFTLIGCNKPTSDAADSTPARTSAMPEKEPAKNATQEGSPATSSSSDPNESAAPTDGPYRCIGVAATNLIKLDKVGEVRLAGVRTPAVGEPGGAWVLDQLKHAVFGIPVEAEFCKKNPNDGRGHYRAIVAYRDTSGKWHNLNQLMVLEGLALANGEDCHLNLRSYDKFQDAAQNLKKGLWKTVWANGVPAPTSAPMGGPTTTTTPTTPIRPTPRH